MEKEIKTIKVDENVHIKLSKDKIKYKTKSLGQLIRGYQLLIKKLSLQQELSDIMQKMMGGFKE